MNAKRKLQLNRETVRVLTVLDMSAVVGGAGYTCTCKCQTPTPPTPPIRLSDSCPKDTAFCGTTWFCAR